MWINTDVRAIYLTYFIILFLIDLRKMENTCVCLVIIIKIEPHFLSLFYLTSPAGVFRGDRIPLGIAKKYDLS